VSKFEIRYMNMAGKDWSHSMVNDNKKEASPLTAEEYDALKSNVSARRDRSYTQPNLPAITSSHKDDGIGQYEPWDDDLIDTATTTHAGEPKAKTEGISAPYVRCYESHTPLQLGDGLVVYGGSCHSPVVTDANIYVALDGGFKNTTRHWPWTESPALEIRFPIDDMQIPKSKKDFVQLIAWLAEGIKAGKKVHVGCIGGHGRTGMVLTALLAAFNPEMKDVIQQARAGYCTKIVESDKQVKFLMEVTGCDTAAAAKSSDSTYASWSKSGAGKQGSLWSAGGKYQGGSTSIGSKVAFAVNSDTCVWGNNAISKK